MEENSKFQKCSLTPPTLTLSKSFQITSLQLENAVREPVHCIGLVK